MFDAAIGPRLEASSLRIRSVFSAAGTFDAGFAAFDAGWTTARGAGAAVRGALLFTVVLLVAMRPL
jgi:hypothetical protein